MPETRANVSHKLDAWYWAHVVIKPDGYAYCVCVKNCTKKWKYESRPGTNIEKHIRKSRPDLVPNSNFTSILNHTVQKQDVVDPIHAHTSWVAKKEKLKNKNKKKRKLCGQK